MYEEKYLYDLEEDPWEQHNLAADSRYEEVRKKLREKLLDSMEQAGEERPEIRAKEKLQ